MDSRPIIYTSITNGYDEIPNENYYDPDIRYVCFTDGTVEHKFKDHPKIHKVTAPIMEISSTFIRNAIKEQKNIKPLLPLHVWKYVDEMNFYRK